MLKFDSDFIGMSYFKDWSTKEWKKFCKQAEKLYIKTNILTASTPYASGDIYRYFDGLLFPSDKGPFV